MTNSLHNTTYPSLSAYKTAIRYPEFAFRKKDPQTKVESDLDSELVAGKPVEITDSNGSKSLWIAVGGWACVFKYETYSPQIIWAIRCFTASTSTVEKHYFKVENQLKNISCFDYFLTFKYLKEGIRVNGNLYAILKMEWAEGKDLKKFIQANLNDKSKLYFLAQAWKKLSKDLLDAKIAHGDLQHGNILVDDSHGITLKLVDYDSLYFEKVDGNNVDDEIKGIEGYQHPLRNSITKQCPQIDFFSQIVIYISILALAEDKNLWNIYKLDDTERLLFSTADFKNPDSSQIFHKLSQLPPHISKLVNELKEICKLTNFSQIPSLNHVLKEPVPSQNVLSLLVQLARENQSSPNPPKNQALPNQVSSQPAPRQDVSSLIARSARLYQKQKNKPAASQVKTTQDVTRVIINIKKKIQEGTNVPVTPIPITQLFSEIRNWDKRLLELCAISIFSLELYYRKLILRLGGDKLGLYLQKIAIFSIISIILFVCIFISWSLETIISVFISLFRTLTGSI